jgi:carbonic anhydrase
VKNDIQKFMSKCLTRNQEFIDIFSGQLENLKESQNPEFYVLMCGDSRCTENVFSGKSVELGKVFGGPSTMGNIISDDVMAALAFNIDHLKTKYFVVCGHTGCGAIQASMKDFSKERPVFKKTLAHLKDSYEKIEVHPYVQNGDDCVQNVFKNVQAQVLKVIDEFQPEIESGAVYDNQGALGKAGKIYFTSINGDVCMVNA